MVDWVRVTPSVSQARIRAPIKIFDRLARVEEDAGRISVDPPVEGR